MLSATARLIVAVAICADEKTPTTLVVTPASLRAPEMMLGGVWSLPVDIWAFGIMVRHHWDLFAHILGT